MSQNILLEQRNQASTAISGCLASIDRIESSLRSKQGNVSKGKRMMAMLIPLALIAVTAVAVMYAFKMPLMMSMDTAKIVFLVAGISTAAFLALQIARIKMNDAYYKAVFEGLGAIDRIRKTIELYERNLVKRWEQMLACKPGNWMLPVEKGPDYEKELHAIDARITGLEQSKSKTLEKVIAVVYYVASFSVALSEMLVLQLPATNLLMELVDFGDTIYLICMLISVIGGPLIGTYYFHKCRGIGFQTISFLWIALDAIAVLLLCAIVVVIIALVIAAVLFILQLVAALIGFVIGAFILYSICAGA